MGLRMLILTSNGHSKHAFEAIDLAVIACVLLAIFVEYLYKLVTDLGKEEEEVQTILKLYKNEMAGRQQIVFKNVDRSSLGQILLLP